MWKTHSDSQTVRLSSFHAHFLTFVFVPLKLISAQAQGNPDFRSSAGTNASDSEWIVLPEYYINRLRCHFFRGQMFTGTTLFFFPSSLPSSQTISLPHSSRSSFIFSLFSFVLLLLLRCLNLLFVCYLPLQSYARIHSFTCLFFSIFSGLFCNCCWVVFLFF